jgi:hypothetical protein
MGENLKLGVIDSMLHSMLPSSLLLLYLSLFTIFTFSILLDAKFVNAIRPIAIISPECGEIEDHRINLTINGFNPNGNVDWEFVDSKGKQDQYGYFETNETGGFNDYTIAEELEPDTYTLRFFDDKDIDYIKDSNASEVLLNYQVPCK